MLELFQKKSRLFLNFVLEFLIADYSSWGFLDISFMKKAKTGNGQKGAIKEFFTKKRYSER